MILDVAGSIPVGRPNRLFAKVTKVPLRDLTPVDNLKLLLISLFSLNSRYKLTLSVVFPVGE